MAWRLAFVAVFAIGVATVLSAHAAVPLNGAVSRPSVSIGQQAPDVHFAEAIEDLPLMKGLEIVRENDVLFLFGSDRIAQTTAKGPVDIDSVYYFYETSLPQLGWTKISPRLYERGGERLRLNARSANPEGETVVRFEIEPLSADSKAGE